MSNNPASPLRRPNIPASLRPLPPLSADILKQQPVVQEAAPKPPPPPPAPTPPPPVVVQHTEEAEQEVLHEIPTVQADTYLCVGTKEQGYVEFDLMSHREKGNEVRYLNIQLQGFSLDDRGKVNNTYMAITNREDFEKVKSFFSTLKWED